MLIRRSVALVSLALAAMCMLSACLATSRPFKEGAFVAGPLIASELSTYVAADSATPPDLKARSAAAAEALRSATAGKEAIDINAVEAAWAEARAPYVAYVVADKSLKDADRDCILATVAKFQALIDAERGRLTGLGIPQR